LGLYAWKTLEDAKGTDILYVPGGLGRLRRATRAIVCAASRGLDARAIVAHEGVNLVAPGASSRGEESLALLGNSLTFTQRDQILTGHADAEFCFVTVVKGD